MTKAGVLNLFAIVRNVGFSALAVGLLFLGLGLYLRMNPLPVFATGSLAIASSAAGIGLALLGLVLALMGSLTRLFIRWTRFRAD